jgi:hypothetical protein
VALLALHYHPCLSYARYYLLLVPACLGYVCCFTFFYSCFAQTAKYSSIAQAYSSIAETQTQTQTGFIAQRSLRSCASAFKIASAATSEGGEMVVVGGGGALR